MIRKKNVSTSFAVFLNTFLIVSTVIVFAVLLFLSYENTINSLLANSISHTETTCEGISDDILKIYNNMDDSNAADLSSYLDIYMGSETLRNVGNVYIVIDDGTILYSNNMDVRGNKIVDEHSIEAINGSTTELDTKTSKTSQTIFVRTIKRIGDTGMVCFVEYEASVTDAREDYIRVVLMPALISMLVAIALFVGFI